MRLAVSASKSAKAQSPRTQGSETDGAIDIQCSESRATPPNTQVNTKIDRFRHWVLYPSAFSKIDEPLKDTS